MSAYINAYCILTEKCTLTHSTRNTHCALLFAAVPVKCVRNARYIFARFTLSPKSRKPAETYFSHFLCYNNPFYYMCIEKQRHNDNDNAIRVTYTRTHKCNAIMRHSLAFNAISKYQENYDNSLLRKYVHFI